MIGLPAGTRIWLAAGITDMRAGMNGLAAKVDSALKENPYSGHVFVFRGQRGDMITVLWWTGDGLCLLAKRLENGRFVRPQASGGSVTLSQAPLSVLLEGIDWRHHTTGRVVCLYARAQGHSSANPPWRRQGRAASRCLCRLQCAVRGWRDPGSGLLAHDGAGPTLTHPLPAPRSTHATLPACAPASGGARAGRPCRH